MRSLETVMTTPHSKERHLFERAFNLAYWIHVNKEVAFFVAEDALDGLSTMLGRQEKNRKPFEQLRGFLKWGERTRPVSSIHRAFGLHDHQAGLVLRHVGGRRFAPSVWPARNEVVLRHPNAERFGTNERH